MRRGIYFRMVERVEAPKEPSKEIKSMIKYNKFMVYVNMCHNLSKFALVICGVLFVFGYSNTLFSELINKILVNLFILFVVSFLLLLYHTIIHMNQFIKK